MTRRVSRSVVALFVALAVAAALALWVRSGTAPSSGDATGPVIPADAAFVGSTACAACHSDAFDAWNRSQHRQAMAVATPASVLGDFAGATFTYNGVVSSFSRKGDTFIVRTDGPDGVLGDYAVSYTFGVYPLQQYLVEFPDGRLQALSIAWDARPRAAGGQRWFHLYAHERIDHRDELHWTGRQQNWNFMCADCHSTNVRKGYDADANRFRTMWSEVSVGCEACHGPASRHVRWATASSWQRSLLWSNNGLTATLDERRDVAWTTGAGAGKPVRSQPRVTNKEIEVCAPCHARRTQLREGHVAGDRLANSYAVATLGPGLYFADGQQQDEVYTYGSFLQSKMHAAGVTCADCHEPHTAKLRAEGNALCTRCHTASRYDATAHHHHGPSAAPLGTACVSCHMPARTYMTVDPRRDHSFRVPRPDLSVTLGVPNACTGCHQRETESWAADAVRRWYGRNAVGFQTFGVAFASHERSAGEGAPTLVGIATNAAQPAFVRASAADRLAGTPTVESVGALAAMLADADETVRRAALRTVDALAPAERLLAVPLLADRVRAVRVEAARVLAPANATVTGPSERASLEAATREFIDASRLHADRPEARTNLGTVLMELGRASEAIAEFAAAVRLEPRYVPAYVNMADAYARQGQEREGEAALRRGIEANPENGDLHHALGLSFARSGQHSAATTELEIAAKLRPDMARFSYAHAVALNSTGRSDQAIAVVTAARQRHPRDRDLLFALATFQRDAGRRTEARRAADELTRLVPGDEEAAALARDLAGIP